MNSGAVIFTIPKDRTADVVNDVKHAALAYVQGSVTENELCAEVAVSIRYHGLPFEVWPSRAMPRRLPIRPIVIDTIRQRVTFYSPDYKPVAGAPGVDLPSLEMLSPEEIAALVDLFRHW